LGHGSTKTINFFFSLRNLLDYAYDRNQSMQTVSKTYHELAKLALTDRAKRQRKLSKDLGSEHNGRRAGSLHSGQYGSNIQREELAKMKKIAATILLAIIAVAALAAKTASQEEGTIIVYRKWDLTGAGASDPVNPLGFKMSPDPIKVHVKPGETVYFANYWVSLMGRIFEVAENQEDARHSVGRLKPQN
jgi:hypothetical protein